MRVVPKRTKTGCRVGKIRRAGGNKSPREKAARGNLRAGTQGRRARDDARLVQQHLAAVIEGIVDGVALFDQDERLVLFNRRYATEVSRLGDLFKPGLKFEDFIRALAKSGYYGPVDENWIRTRLRRFRDLEDVEYAVSGGGERPNWISVRHYRTGDGETLIVISDITARKQSEAERETARQFLITALDSMRDGVALFDKDERLVLWNESYLAALPHLRGFLRLGVTFPQLIQYLAGVDHYIGVDKDWVEVRLRKFRALEPIEIQTCDPDGREFWHAINHYRTSDGGTFLVRADITESKRTAAELESARLLLQTALDSMSDGVALFDKDERLVLVNEGYVSSIRLSRDLIKPGIAFSELVTHFAARDGNLGEDKNWAEWRLRQFRSLEPAELHFRDKEGNERWAIVHHYRTRDGGTFLVRTDITERKRAEGILRKSEAQLRALIEHAPVQINIKDLESRYLVASPDLLKAWNFTAEQVIGKSARDLYPKDFADRLMAQDRATIASGKNSVQEVIRPSPQGPRVLSVVKFPIPDDQGRPIALGSITSDITERKRAEMELESSQHLLQVALDSITDGVALYDKDERLVMCNEGYAKSLTIIGDILKPGISITEEIAALVKRGNYRDAGEDWGKERVRIFRALEPVESCQRDLAGNDRWFSSRHYRTRDGGTFLVRTDITQRKRAEAELAAARQHLQEALDSMTDGVALFDRDERLVLWNEGYISTSPALREIVKPGMTFTEIVAQMTAQGRYLGVGQDWVERRVRQFRALEAVENHIRDPDGSERWAQVNLYRTRDGGTFMVRTDVTARKRAEAERESAQQLLRTALESISDGVALFGKDERIVLWNESYIATRSQLRGFLKPGLTFAEIIRHLSETGGYADTDKDMVESRVCQFRALTPVELHVRDPDGRERWAEVRHYRTRDDGTFLVRADITAQKRAMEQLEASQQLLQTAIDSMNDGIALFDKNERLVLFNDAYINSSMTVRDFVRPGMTFADIVTHLTAKGLYGRDEKDWVNRRLRQFRALEAVEMRVYDPERGERWSNTRLYRTRDGGTLLVRTDITQSRRAVEELNGARQLLQTAIDSMAEGIALFDKNERLVLFNGNFPGRFKLPPGLVKPGLAFKELIAALLEHGAYVGAGKDLVDVRVRQFRALEPAELKMLDQDMSESWFRVNFYRTRDGGTLMVRTDITGQMRAMGEIEAARAEAEAASASKSRFLASMSHELRTPLNAILGFAQMLELGQGKMPEAKAREYLDIILRSGQHLLDLVEQILDLSLVENQRAELRIQELSPVKKAQECVDMIYDEATRYQVEILNRTGDIGPDVRFLGDSTRVRQVLLNLLSNAVKYNRPGGRVTIECARADGGMIRFSVVDTGMGIPEDRRTDVFEPFQRLGREAGQIEGSGIGLALSRQLLLLMGGRIGFESEAGKGSTFWFILPEAKHEARV